METNNGWIKLHRCLLSKAIWKCSTPEQCKLLIIILLLANHEPSQWIFEGKKYECKSGEFITSLSSLAKTSGLSIQQVRTALEKFEKLDFLTSKSTKQNRLISIVNWGFYQEVDEQGNKQPNKQVTKSQQTSNKEVTTNKNNKNVRMIRSNNNSTDWNTIEKDFLSN